MSSPKEVKLDTNYNRAWLPSKITFWFANNLIRIGRRGILSEEDTFPLFHTDTAGHNLSRIFTTWSEEKHRVAALNLKAVGSDLDPRNVTASDQVKLERKAREMNVSLTMPSFLRAMIHSYGLWYFRAAYMLFFESGSKIGAILFLKELVKFIANANDATPIWHGFLYALGLFACSLIQALSSHQHFFLGFRSGMNMRLASSAIIFSKSLALKSVDFKDISVGTALNLLSSDTWRFEEFGPFFNYVWAGPTELCVILYLVYREVGVTMFYGMGLFLLIVLTQYFYSPQFSRMRQRTAKLTDERLKTVSEVLSGAEVVKMYGWETPLAASVETVRQQEVKSLRGTVLLKATNMAFYFSTIVAVSMVTFLIHSYGRGLPLVSSSVFSIIGFFNCLAFPLMSFMPLGVEKFMEILVVSKRIGHFLSIGENLFSSSPNFSLSLPPTQNEDEGFSCSTCDQYQKDATSAQLNDAAGAAPGLNLQPSSRAVAEIELQPRPVHNGDQQDPDSFVDQLPFGSVYVAPETVFAWPSTSSASSSSSASADESDDASAGSKTLCVPFHLQPKSFCAVIGTVGAGKSSLLQALAGEMPVFQGSQHVFMSLSGSRVISYAPQKPWMNPSSIRENIVFGSPFDEARYRTVIKVCGLERDLSLFEGGDYTIVGERGSNLSGGQRARVGLARAVYAKADVYLLDDVLSAVDQVVAKQIFDDCLGPKGFLSDCTRILVTHQLHFLPQFDVVLELANGSLKELIESPRSMDPASLDEELSICDTVESPIAPTQALIDAEAVEKTADNLRAEKASQQSVVQLESKAQGGTSFSVYISYFTRHQSPFVVILLLITLLIPQGLKVAADYTLSSWADTTPDDQQREHWRLLYGVLAGATIFMGFVRSTSIMNTILSCAAKAHDKMFTGVLFAKMSFFQRNPAGRILNRFSKDQMVIDELLPFVLFDLLQALASILGVVVIICMVSPYIILTMLIIFPIFYWLRKGYVACSREIKRLEATTRSKFLSHFSSTLTGLPVIRAFNRANFFESGFLDLMDHNSKVFFSFYYASRWLGVRLDFTANMLVLVTGFVIVGLKDTIPAGNVGLILTYVQALVSVAQWGVRQSGEFENMMTSAERVMEYGDLPCEGQRFGEVPYKLEDHSAPTDQEDSSENQEEGSNSSNKVVFCPASSWPENGYIQVKNVFMKYQDDLPDVLRGLTFNISPRHKVGVCGRTGAGKSSLFNAFFRLTTLRSGTILIDGVDISSIGISDLRKQLSIIPQQPIVFSGSLRYNLDPFTEFSDEAIVDSLSRCQLSEWFESLPDALDTMLSEGGGNISTGQAQLVCIARALLRPSKILLIDEATANIDPTTDGIVQKIFREAFSDRTSLTIAHRLDTILHCDQIIVLDAGRVAEIGSPSTLLADKEGMFAQMYRAQQEELKETD